MKKSNLNIILIISLSLSILLSVKCDDDDDKEIKEYPIYPAPLVKNPCTQLSSSIVYCIMSRPANGSIFQKTNPTLSWIATSTRKPIYTLYFGTSKDNLKVISTQPVTYYALQNLEKSKTYYWKFSALDTCGHGCSAGIYSFTIIPDTSLPYVVTIPDPVIMGNSVSVGGNVIYTGLSPLTDIGIYYGKQTEPEKTGIKVSLDCKPGQFYHLLENLDEKTQYYVKAFASNTYGSYYANEISFKTEAFLTSDSISDIVGNKYGTIKIGNQIWMSENLRTTRLNDSSPISFIYDSMAWNNTLNLNQFATWLYNDSTYKLKYGAIYNGYIVNSGKLCPSGWHVPTDNEWKALEMQIGMTNTDASEINIRGTDQGLILKSKTEWLEQGNGFNSVKFGGFPGGMRFPSGSFGEAGTIGQWWSSTKASNYDFLWSRSLLFNASGVSRTLIQMQYGCSVRCIKD
jgi:uncharacterized protein (TIGR02145 family)